MPRSAPTWDVVPVIAVGESATIEREPSGAALLVRTADTVYCLSTPESIAAGRARWGTRRQIASDIDHFLVYGRLPGPDGPRW